MAKIKVAIFDVDQGYRERFADYLMNHKASEMELAVFTNEQFFYEALEVDKFHLFVLGGGYEEVLPRARAKKVPVLVLTECIQSYVKETIQMLDEQVVYTSKYQSMDAITQKMQVLVDSKHRYSDKKVLQRNTEIVGIISPVSHEMQTLFSLVFSSPQRFLFSLFLILHDLYAYFKISLYINLSIKKGAFRYAFG